MSDGGAHLGWSMRGTRQQGGLAEALKGVVRGGVIRCRRDLPDLPLECWGLSRDAAGALTLHDTSLEALVERWGSPLHVVDARRLDDNSARFTAAPAGEGATLQPEVFASYKTNPLPGLMRRVHAAGLGAEVVSPYELWLALRLGVPPASIIYNGPAKSEASLVEALRRGVGLINVNARSELAPLAALARRLGVRPRVGVRVVLPGRWGGQFGERIDGGAALSAFREARALPELEVVALHAHLGGELATAPQVKMLVAGVLDLADALRDQLGLELEILDLGGNLACPTTHHLTAWDHRLAVSLGWQPAPRPPSHVLTIEGYLAALTAPVVRHYRALGRPPPRVFLEPGRALTGDAELLLTRAIQVREPDSAGLTWAVLDAGINVAESVRAEWHQLLPLRRRPGTRRLYRLTGPSCMQGDLLYPAWSLPELRPGDGLAIMDAGAYFFPFSTDFSFPRPAVVQLGDGPERLLRQAERFEDLVAADGEHGIAVPPERWRA